MQTENFDLIIVGGGKAGKTMAMDLAKQNVRVALVQEDKIGGTCINVGCVPTKSLVATARAVLQARHAEQVGVIIPQDIQLDIANIRAHKEGVVGGMINAHKQMFTNSNMTFMWGRASFVDNYTLDVTPSAFNEDNLPGENHDQTRRIRAPRILINTGSSPAFPPIPGLAESNVWTNEELLELTTLPESLLIIGGGYIGAEFASMLSILGVKVSMLAHETEFLPREDRDVADFVFNKLTSQGVAIHLGWSTTKIERLDNHDVLVTNAAGETITGAEILVATGRKPNTQGLGLENTTVELNERGFIKVNEYLETTQPGVFAAGDVNGGPMFTHVSWSDYRIIKANLMPGLGLACANAAEQHTTYGSTDTPVAHASDDITVIAAGANANVSSTTGRITPYTVFITPELARVGMNDDQAQAWSKETGRPVFTGTIQVAAIPRARTMHETEGFWKMSVAKDTGEILGASLIGPESGEIISIVQMAMLGKLPYWELRNAVISHPTIGEGLNLLAEALQ